MEHPIILDFIPAEALLQIVEVFHIFERILTASPLRYFFDDIEVGMERYFQVGHKWPGRLRVFVNVNGVMVDGTILKWLQTQADLAEQILKLKEERQKSGVNPMHGPGCDCQPKTKEAEFASEPEPEAAPSTDFPRVMQTENATVIQVSAQDLDKIMEILAAQKEKKPEYSKKIEAEIPESIKNAVQAMDACTWTGEETDPVPLMRSPKSRDIPGQK